MKFRVYAGGDIVSEEDFAEYDNAQTYYDDYRDIEIRDEIIDNCLDVEDLEDIINIEMGK